MAGGKQPLVEESTLPMSSEDDPSRPCVRRALFLRPRAGDDGAPLPAPPGDPGAGPVRVREIQAEFRGWACVPRRWREWVDKLRPRHEPLWRELGILGAVLASACRLRRRKHERALLQLAAFWSAATGTFVFPWGEATVTLEDVAALAGLPLLGGPVRAPMSDQLEKEAAAIDAVRSVLNRSKKKKSTFGAWVKQFVERTPDKDKAASAGGGGGGGGEARELLEHGAFLAMWLCLFVLPAPPFDVVRREVFPIAARLARGQRVALAPAALVSIYGDLSALKRHISLGAMKKEPFVSSSPVHILQLWVWERFPQLRPEPASSPAPGGHDMPRAARWSDVVRRFSSKEAHAVFMSPKEFEWRPYGNCSFFALQPEIDGPWVQGQDIATSEALLCFARCLHACELVGMNCIEPYSPHRVARQLGFDQDVPGMVSCASSGWEKAWDTYNIVAESSALIVPSHKPGVTVRYAQWWKPYSSASGTGIANATKMKERHEFVSPMKRKREGIPSANSSKKLHVNTATQGQPPHISEAANLYPSQFSASQAARRRAAGAPGLFLRACPPHLRFRAVSTTAASRMPQTVADAADDLLDHIPLAQRLRSITKTPKQHVTEFLVKGGGQEQNVGSLKSSIPRSGSVVSKKEVLHKDVAQALADAVTNTAIAVDEPYGESITKKVHGKCLQQSGDKNLNIDSEENNNRKEYCNVLPNVVPGAVRPGRNEAIGTGTDVDMLATHENFLVTSDDDECDKSSREECEVNLMHVKTHMLGTKTSHIRVGNKDSQLVDASNDVKGSQVLEKVAIQGNHVNIVEINDDELDEEASKEDGLGTMHMHLKSPKMEAASSILPEPNEQNHPVSERNDEQDNLVVMEVMVQNSCDSELGSVPNNRTLRQQQDVLTHAATLQTDDDPLEGPTKKMHTCTVTGEVDNTDRMPNEKTGSLDNEKGNEDILVSNQDLESPMEDSTGANRMRSGDNERFSSSMPDGNTELISSEVCTKTLYYLSRFDRLSDAWDKDANSTGTDQDVYMPRRAVGTMEMIKKASAIRHAEIAELRKKIHDLKEEILVLEAAEQGKPLK